MRAILGAGVLAALLLCQAFAARADWQPLGTFSASGSSWASHSGSTNNGVLISFEISADLLVCGPSGAPHQSTTVLVEYDERVVGGTTTGLAVRFSYSSGVNTSHWRNVAAQGLKLCTSVTPLGSPPQCDIWGQDGFSGVQGVDEFSFVAGYCQSCATPVVGCRGAEKSLLLVKADTVDNETEKLIWKWIKGQATAQGEFGNPIDSADYILCVYAGTAASKLAEVPVLADTVKWAEINGKGYKYKDKSGVAAGVQKMILKGSTENKAKALVKGKGAGLPDPTLGSLPLPVTAQLLNSDTEVCFQGVYDIGDVIKNEPEQFKAKAQ